MTNRPEGRRNPDEELDIALAVTIAQEIEKEWGMSGLSSGIYFAFAKEMLCRYAQDLFSRHMKREVFVAGEEKGQN